MTPVEEALKENTESSAAMAAVRSLRVSVRSDSGSEHSDPDSDSGSDRDQREAEPMEVEEGEVEAEDVSVKRSLKELLPVSRPHRPWTHVSSAPRWKPSIAA